MTQNKMGSILGIVGFTIFTGIIAFGLSAQIMPSAIEGDALYRPEARTASFGLAEQEIMTQTLPSHLGQEFDTLLPPLLVDDTVLDLQSLEITTQTEMVTQEYARGLHMNCGGY